jgi:hypothetical protein
MATRKTIHDHQEDALYREVWEEVRIQHFYDFVRDNIKWIFVAAILIIASAVVVQIIRHSNAETQKSEIVAFESAMAMAAERQIDGAEVLLVRMAENSSGGMGDLALYRAAQIATKAGRESDAIAKLESLAKHGATRDFKHLAVIKVALIKSRDLTAKEFERALVPLMTKRSPFYYTALYLVAMRYAEDGDRAAGRKYATKIIDDKSAPLAIAAQAEALAKYLQ